MKRLPTFILAFVMAVVVAVPLSASLPIDDDPEVVSLYAKGERLMREGDYHGASRVFEQLAGFYAKSKNLDLFTFQRGKAKLYAGEYAAAAAGFNYFLTRFPNSAYRAHATYFLANAQYLRSKLTSAVSNYIEAYRLSDDVRLDRLIVRSLEAAVDAARLVRLTPGDFDALSHQRRCELISAVSRRLAVRGDIALAEQLSMTCGETLDPKDYPSAPTGRKRIWEIAALMPFSGELQTFGHDLYNGCVLAARMFRETMDEKLIITPYDTKGDPIEAARIVKELSQDRTIDAVVGPLTSDEAAVSAAALSCVDLPLLAPAATQAGFTRLASGVFQMSASVELQGVRMAEYAVRELDADSAAVITPTTTDELRMSRAFVDRFEQLGGTVVAVEYYRARDRDFGPYVRDVKSVILGLPPDSVVYVNERGDTLEVDGIPAHVDALFLPGSADQIRLLLPQVRFYTLNGALLGSDGWGDPAVIKLGDDITRQAVFPSTFLKAGSSAEQVTFAAAYDSRYGEPPGRLASLGYDAIALMARAVQAGATGRQSLIDKLAGLGPWSGASGVISFGEHRENLEMPLYRISNGSTHLLGEEGPTDNQPEPGSDSTRVAPESESE